MRYLLLFFMLLLMGCAKTIRVAEKVSIATKYRTVERIDTVLFPLASERIALSTYSDSLFSETLYAQAYATVYRNELSLTLENKDVNIPIRVIHRDSLIEREVEREVEREILVTVKKTPFSMYLLLILMAAVNIFLSIKLLR